MNYNYSPTHKFRLESVMRHHFRSDAGEMLEGDVVHDICRFSYDSNGNMTGMVTDHTAADGHIESRTAERKLLWDEENRLRAVDDNGFISCYFYDASGNRTIKLTGGSGHGYVNGEKVTSPDRTETGRFMIYPSSNMVYSHDEAAGEDRFTCHIYAGTERIISAVSGTEAAKTPSTAYNNDNRNTYLLTHKQKLQTAVKDIYEACQVPFNGTDYDKSSYTSGGGGLFSAQYASPTATSSATGNTLYFYHPDHLGSTTLMTDAAGKPTQRVEYAPFGELFIDKRHNDNVPEGTWQTSYLFNAKEYDEETGLYYYGARYYDPHLSLWLSPDPMERKYPFFSSYSYTMNNPVRFADFMGLDAEDRVRIARSMSGIPYKPETQYKLRTENTPEALAFMDCSEFVCRVMAADGITSKVESMSSSYLKVFLGDTDKFFHTMQAKEGDIALWEGHTGIVTGVGEGRNVVITHARGKDNPSGENSKAILPEKYRPSSQFYGYYRPVNEVTPDNNIYSGGSLEEVVITAPAPASKPLDVRLSTQLNATVNGVPIPITKTNSNNN